MQKIINLNEKNLSLLPPEVSIPAYDRSKLKSGIVHIGVGGFHRSHQALYTDDLIGVSGGSDWAICGVGLLEPDRLMFQNLKSQDYLYTLMVSHPDGTFTASVIGSVIEYIFAPDDPEAVIEKMAHPSTKIVSLQLFTPKGLNFSSNKILR
jgi:mannitol 2-dehydrogenase